MSNVSVLLNRWGLSPQGVGGLQPRFPCQLSVVLIVANLRSCELWEVSYTEGGAGCSLLQSRRAKKTSRRTTVYRVTRWLALVVSKCPSWLQSTGIEWNILESAGLHFSDFFHFFITLGLNIIFPNLVLPHVIFIFFCVSVFPSSFFFSLQSLSSRKTKIN